MIACMSTSEHPLHWKKIFAQSYVGLAELRAQQQPHYQATTLQQIEQLFPIRLSTELLRQFEYDHPVLKQYMPDARELINPAGYGEDPVGDQDATLAGGMLKKYQHRALIITTNTCPVHCRYCFRKDYPYSRETPNQRRYETALTAVKNDRSLNEIILSGGDPLSLDDDLLGYLFTSLAAIKHIKTVRVHTKFPSIYPQRVTHQLLTLLANTRLNTVVVLHINHPEEINQSVKDAAEQIRQTNTTTLNQAVLLRGVNDNADTLVELSRKLFSAGILPYYLHLLDKAKGTHHFYVQRARAEMIMQQLKQRLPGYLVPKLAQEISGHRSKDY